MTNVMTNAWEIARQGVEKFGGQIKEYFAEALRIAWDLFKNKNSKEMEEMELVKEVKFGKAVARITVKGTFENETFHQFVKDGEVIITQKIEIVANGKVIGEARHADAMENNEIYDYTYKKNNLDTRKTYTQIKGVGICEGRETADEINALIQDMKNEIETHYKGEVEQVEETDLVENAKKIVEIAEQQGVEKLMTEKEINEWRKQYNEVVNEGGEGYIPRKVSKEQYRQALKTLGSEA